MAIRLNAEIALINDSRNLLISHSSLIQQNANQILLRVTSQEVDDTLASVLTSYAQISLLNSEIDLLVAKSSYTGTEIRSRINLGTGGIKIQADKIDLTGYATFNNLATSGQTTINGANITTGKILAQYLTFTGAVGTNVNLTGILNATSGIFNNVTIESTSIFKGTITTIKDVVVGTKINLKEIVVSTIIEQAQESLGKNGLSWGDIVNTPYKRNAFVTAFNAGALAGVANSWAMVLYSSNAILIDTPNIRMKLGGTEYTVSRDSNGFLKAT